MAEHDERLADALRQAIAAAIVQNRDSIPDQEACCKICGFSARLATPVLEALAQEIERPLKEGLSPSDIGGVAAGTFGEIVALAVCAAAPSKEARQDFARAALEVFVRQLFQHAGLGQAALVSRPSGTTDDDDDVLPPGVTQH